MVLAFALTSAFWVGFGFVLVWLSFVFGLFVAWFPLGFVFVVASGIGFGRGFGFSAV